MKTKHFLTCVAFLLGCVAIHAAQPGETCTTAIPLGTEYKADITGSQTVWYSAWTFDLPLAVYFMPQNESDPAPEVEMDFTCTKGVYTDSIICSLFCPNSGSGINIDMPHKPKLKTDHIDGKLVYYLAVGKEYRDLLLKVGISYNVEVFVKVTYHSKGMISIAPDDMFSSCMDGAKFKHMGDTIRVKAKDKDRHVIVPYVQWQQDSIYYIWNGDSKVTIAIGADCKHDPTDGEDETILQRKNIQPGDSLKVTSADMTRYVKFEDNEAGMFFLKCYSTSDGVLTIKKVPQAPPRGNATLLKYDQQVVINSNDTNALYAIPSSWDTATIFTTPTDHIFKMYVHTEPDFLLKDAMKSYQFLAYEKGHWLGIFDEDMKALWENTTEKYLYVRFECAVKTTLMPRIWDTSDCLLGSTLIHTGTTTLSVEKGSYGAKYYRFYYNSWRGGDIIFQWNGTRSTCPTYIGDTCTFAASASNAHVIVNKKIQKGDSWSITKDELVQWATRVDPDGYLYIRFNPDEAGEMVVTSTAPDEIDPVYPSATISVKCEEGTTNNLVVNVSEAQHISIQGSGFSDEWDAIPGEEKKLHLDAGQYLLQGEKEQITVLIP